MRELTIPVAFALLLTSCTGGGETEQTEQLQETAASLLLVESECSELGNQLSDSWQQGIRFDNPFWYQTFQRETERDRRAAIDEGMSYIRATLAALPAGSKTQGLVSDLYPQVVRLCGLVLDPSGHSLVQFNSETLTARSELLALKARAELELGLPPEAIGLQQFAPKIATILRSAPVPAVTPRAALQPPAPLPPAPEAPAPLTLPEWHRRHYLPAISALEASPYTRVANQLLLGATPKIADCEATASAMATLLQEVPSPPYDSELGKAMTQGLTSAMEMGEACSLSDITNAREHAQRSVDWQLEASESLKRYGLL